VPGAITLSGPISTSASTSVACGARTVTPARIVAGEDALLRERGHAREVDAVVDARA